MPVAKAELVRCAEHGEAACWQQFDGSHKSRHECTCEEKPPYLCPIDAHSVRYLLNNPEWEEEAPKLHAKPTAKLWFSRMRRSGSTCGYGTGCGNEFHADYIGNDSYQSCLLRLHPEELRPPCPTRRPTHHSSTN